MITVGFDGTYILPINNYGRTNLCLGMVSTGTGIITSAKAWSSSKWGSTLTFGTFYGSGDTYTPRDFVNIGRPVAGYHVSTGLELNIEVGDVIGAYHVNCYGAYGELTGERYATFVGDGTAGTQTYALSAVPQEAIIYGTGEEVSVGSKAFLHHYRRMMAGGVGKRC